MLTKNSPELQDLLSRIQQVVPGLTGPVSSSPMNLWEYKYNGHVGIEMVYDQEPPTAMLREFRPGHYSLIVVYLNGSSRMGLDHQDYDDETSPPTWEVSDYGCGVWFIPITDNDNALLEALQVTT